MIASYICDCYLNHDELQWHTVKRSEVPRSSTTYFNVANCHNLKGNDS